MIHLALRQILSPRYFCSESERQEDRESEMRVCTCRSPFRVPYYDEASKKYATSYSAGNNFLP